MSDKIICVGGFVLGVVVQTLTQNFLVTAGVFFVIAVIAVTALYFKAKKLP